MGKTKDETVKPGGGVDGERDPLTVGATTYGEDVKGNSTFDVEPSSDEPTADEKSEELTADQQEVDAKANTPDALLPDEGSDEETPADGKTSKK